MCQRFIEMCCVIKKYTHIKLRYNWNNFCHKPAKCTPCPNPFVPIKKAETARLLESAVSGEAFLTQADCSVITLGGSTSTERGERENETGFRRETTRERKKINYTNSSISWHRLKVKVSLNLVNKTN